MHTQAVLSRYGTVQPSEFDRMDLDEAREQARRVFQMHREEIEERMEFDAKLAGARLQR